VAIAEINEKCPYIDLKYINRTQNRSKKIEGFDFAWLNEQVQPSKVKQNPLFTVEDPMDYTDYYGMNCKIKNMVCEHLLVITPLTDGSINCSFRSGENYHFASIENLLETKIGIISRRKGAWHHFLKLSFRYEVNFISLGTGRPKAKDVIIEVLRKD